MCITLCPTTSSRSGCSEDQLIGRWGEQSSYGLERQTALVTFYSDGTAIIELTRGTETETLSATYSLDAGCKLTVDICSGATLGEGFLAMNGYVATLTTRDTDDGGYGDYTFLKIGE